MVRLNRTPTTFSLDPLMDVVPIARKLQSRGDAVSAYLHNKRLLPTTQVALSKWRDTGSGLGALSVSLVNALNEVICGPCIHQPSIFRDVALRPETRRLLERTDPQGPCDRLNRLLLEDAYPTELPREQLEVVTYVRDYERLREYLHPEVGDERRNEIRGAFWEQYRGAVADKLLAMFRNRFPDVSPDDPRIEVAAGWVQDRLFVEPRFGETVKKYTTEGKTFAGFIEYLLIGRCCDAVDEFASEPEICPIEVVSTSSRPSHNTGEAEVEGVEPEDLQAEPESSGEDAPESAAELLRLCLSNLRYPEERAVVELRYRAYVNPSLGLISEWTLDRVAHSASRAQLQEQYDADQQALRTLQEQEIPILETERQQAYACREAKQDALGIQGWSCRRISRLREFLPATIQEAEAELENAATTSKRRQELEFQIACIRYQKARNRLQVAREQLERYKQARFPWVRTQEEIASLLRMDQVTVSNRLKKALTAMRAWRVVETYRQAQNRLSGE
ncbi:MAG: hypothetical protein GX456_07030 [Verrucomicrobia bacterium]|nr:hypothetical protein [Verrucomicrobiota bacterium]